MNKDLEKVQDAYYKAKSAYREYAMQTIKKALKNNNNCIPIDREMAKEFRFSLVGDEAIYSISSIELINNDVNLVSTNGNYLLSILWIDDDIILDMILEYCDKFINKKLAHN